MTELWFRSCFLGDSLTHGSRDPWGLSWPYYMSFFAAHDGCTLIPEVHAQPGRTSPELVRMSAPIIEKTEAQEVFILIGTNDGRDNVRLPSDIYVQNLQFLVNVCRVFNKREYVLTIPPPSGFGSAGYTSRIVEHIEKANQAVREANITPRLIDLSDCNENFDGIHFEWKTSVKVAEKAWNAVKKERTFISPSGKS